MAEDRFTFPDSFAGLEHALFTTLTQRRFGAKTRLVTHTQAVGKLPAFVLHTVVATPAPRPTRAERGCFLGRAA
jgi:hypothetical protein